MDTLLKSRTDIIIKSADKGGKNVVMDREMYIEYCQKQLDNQEFYEKIESDPTQNIKEEIRSEVNGMLTDKLISKKESFLLTEHLDRPRLAIFYGIPKIHKVFKVFPPLRPIVSGFNSCTSRLSEFIDTFLKFQAKKCPSYIHDTKDFLNKINNLKSIPVNAILVTMDISSLYTNIDHQEGADACFECLEKRNSKKISSSLLKQLILVVLKHNVFRFGNDLYRQIKGTAMGTPMAVNYANLFLHKFETEMLNDYERKTGLRPYIWLRYIDDIFFIWHHDDKSLQDFLTFCNAYSNEKKMKSNIRFETNSSTVSVNFLDVTLNKSGNIVKTSLYSKPTDAHLYLDAKSSHPPHIVQNIPKGQFIRVRRICSEDADFENNVNHMKKYFLKRGYTEHQLQNSIDTVRKIPRITLLSEKEKSHEKDPHSIFVCTWHPKLKKLPFILRKNFNIISNDPKLSQIFKETPTVAFRKNRNLKSILSKNDIRPKESKDTTANCKGCQLCRVLSKKDITYLNDLGMIKYHYKENWPIRGRLMLLTMKYQPC